MANKTTTISLTAHEIEIIMTALNEYEIKMRESSYTWSKPTLEKFGNEDYFERRWMEAVNIWARFYDAEKELKKEEETIEA